MKYAYYPGCSLRESAREFDVSVRAVMERLGAELEEIPDWTCCGASAVASLDERLALGLPARNLALAERASPGLDILAPCSACYLNLLTAQRAIRTSREARAEAGELLSAEGLSAPAKGGTVRHLLDVLINDAPPEAIRDQVVRPLTGLRVAPYYGCQILRPFRVFDDPERPSSMEPILTALGADIHPWNMGGRCCGASLMATHKETALVHVGEILRAAARTDPAAEENAGDAEDAARGADVIVTVCPMCQMNLEAYQGQALRAREGGKPVTVLYLTQLMGAAMGLAPEKTLLDKSLAVTGSFRSRLAGLKEPSAPLAQEA